MLQHTNAKSLSTVLHVSDRLVTSDYCCQSVGEQSTETQQRVVLKDKFQQYIFFKYIFRNSLNNVPMLYSMGRAACEQTAPCLLNSALAFWSAVLFTPRRGEEQVGGEGGGLTCRREERWRGREISWAHCSKEFILKQCFVIVFWQVPCVLSVVVFITGWTPTCSYLYRMK